VPVLIDGHNLIGRLPMLSLQDPDDEEKLVRLLQSYRGRTGKAVMVVFDPGIVPGWSQARRHGGVEVAFAPHGSSADVVIASKLRRSRDPQSWQVVTSDRRLADTVEQLGARVLSADDFALELGSVQPESTDWKDLPPSPEEVEKWLNLFGDRD
jgi:predicted RNA-binding protein with PIN domain